VGRVPEGQGVVAQRPVEAANYFSGNFGGAEISAPPFFGEELGIAMQDAQTGRRINVHESSSPPLPF
jgi:hypothetical protein